MNFWDVHGWLFLIGIALFPRLTMLLAVNLPFGWLAWLGWLFVPSLLVAILATFHYWQTNPVLCVIAWLWLLVKGEEAGRQGSQQLSDDRDSDPTMTEVVMPQLAESLAEGTISRWMKKVGDKVERDEPLFEVSTDKCDAEIPAPVSGILHQIVTQEGVTVPVDSIVAVIARRQD